MHLNSYSLKGLFCFLKILIFSPAIGVQKPKNSSKSSKKQKKKNKNKTKLEITYQQIIFENFWCYHLLQAKQVKHQNDILHITSNIQLYNFVISSILYNYHKFWNASLKLNIWMKIVWLLTELQLFPAIFLPP